MSLPPQPQDTPEIQIVVDSLKSGTSGTISVRGLHGTARSEIRPNSSSGSSTSYASSKSSQGTRSTEGVTSTQNSLSTSDSRLELPRPIPASDVKRNDRNRTIPKPKYKVCIKPGETGFDYPQRNDGWEPHVHPDGAVYFFDPERRIYTDADLWEDDECQFINHHAEQLLQQAHKTKGFPSTTCILVLERIDEIDETLYGYYFVEPKKRYILWLQEVSIGILAKDLPKVQSMAHIKYAMEAEYWTHCMLFPDRWSVTPEVVAELKKMVLHAIADNVASTTSVIPFDQEELKQILDLIDTLKDGIEELFPHANCVVARFMQDFALSKFFNFCGQPWARLNSDQSIFSKSKPQRSLITKILSLGLFWAPCDYAKELDGIWMDKVVNRIMWRRFIANLNNDWAGLALSATVVLNANVAFLALTGDNAVAKSFSFVSTVTSVGVVLIGLILVRQSQRQDSAEQGDKFLGKMSIPLFRTEILAIIFSLPYALLLWSMVWFIIAFACMVFSSSLWATEVIFGLALGFMVAIVIGTALTTRL